MTDDALSILFCLFQSVWKLFASWYIPGTNLTPAVLFFGIAFCVLLMRFLRSALGLFGSEGDSK